MYQTRNVTCLRINDLGTAVEAEEKLCSEKKPNSEQVCDLEQCPAVWATTPWSQVKRI